MKRANPFDSLRNIAKNSTPPKAKDKKTTADHIEIELNAPNFEFITLNEANSKKSSSLLLIRLRKTEAICFQGKIQLAAVWGSINIFGAILTETSWLNAGSEKQLSFVPVYSPSTNSLITIKSEYLNEAAHRYSKNGSKQELIEIGEMLKNWTDSEYSSIIAIKTLDNQIEKIENMMPVFKNSFNRDVQESLPGLIINPSQNLPIPSFHLSNKNAEAIDSIVSKPNRIICMVGNKNTGKSTISRYISNRLLSKYGKVAYFECDVGQPEFTPPGLISLNEITTPLLGPPFTHHQTPFHSIFYGATSPQQEPDSYLQGLTELLQIYKTNLSNLPMVVNTCGWTKGVGYDLLQHFISLLNPTDIIQLESPETRTLYLPDLLQQNIINSLIIPAVSDLELQKIKINAHDSRSLNMISYFLKEGGRWDFNCPLSKRLPYKVSFSSIPFSESLNALNGSVIGLVIDQQTYFSKGDGSFGFIPSFTPTKGNCVGLGLVRAIDLDNQCFYILTPVEFKVLKKVNLFLRGPLELPVALMTHGYDRSHVPFTTFVGAEGVGSVAHKNRHLGRKKNQ